MTSDADRDEGLAGLREALEPFLSFTADWVDENGWTGKPGRIVDWFGPSEFRRLALAASRLGGEVGGGNRPSCTVSAARAPAGLMGSAAQHSDGDGA